MFYRLTGRFQRGQANTEYIVVVGALVAALIVDVPGTDRSAVEHLTDVIKRNYQGYSYGISVSELPDENRLQDESTD